MTWRSVRAEIEAAIHVVGSVVRTGSDPGVTGTPRSERLAAFGVGLTVLLGAVVTYAVVASVGSLGRW